jgi:GNAT superfamily N-acetyltransferase
MNVVVASHVYEDAIADLFRASECPCFCRYWHFEGDKNAWLERCATAPEKNEAEMRASLVAAGALVALVALEGPRAIGWMKIAPRASLAKLRARRDLRALDLGDDESVMSIGCMLVRPDARKNGVARLLVRRAIDFARERNARVLEAYPHAPPNLGAHEAPERAWMGPHALFTSLGFTHVTGELPYPVMRLAL